ncbi:MAG: hypothetical protein ACOCU3_01120, partial [bacterium]
FQSPILTSTKHIIMCGLCKLDNNTIAKYFVSIFFILLFSNIITDTISAKQVATWKLTDRMHEFFIETLACNYNGNNVFELYENFINHYFELSKSSSTDETNLIIDKLKLKEINNDLFKRDFSHFYYYFNDVLYVTEKDVARAKELVESHPEIPIITVLFEGDINKHPSSLQRFEESHNIYLPLNYGFINEIGKDNIKTITYIKKITDAAGTLNLGLLASFIVNFEGKDELHFEEVQRIISVMFWKYLCLQAGFDFYVSLEKLELLLQE